MWRQKSCRGISLRTMELYALVFTARYPDLFFSFISVYNSAMKVFFLLSSYTIVYWMRTTMKASYDKEHDTFRPLFLIVPSLLLALVINYEFAFFEILWTFSVYLEAVAILPQLFLLQRTQDIETLSAHYIAALGAYRLCYLINWVYRWYTEPGYTMWIVWISGLVQTALYVDFFYYYLKSVSSGQKMALPA
eukprot:TRINITY_DN8007_c0_g1_i2.p1 TRINITY_DN8007_c0_g1~~TRINITY_DN8007_c0_g1_i2.p1  ORF type:complete len:214 (+),score=64.37 TRINITY_DN8007_c0_g1_i2:67-642(+)